MSHYEISVTLAKGHGAEVGSVWIDKVICKAGDLDAAMVIGKSYADTLSKLNKCRVLDVFAEEAIILDSSELE